MRRAGLWLMILGLICIAGAGAWTIWNEMDEQRADEEAQAAVDKLIAAIQTAGPTETQEPCGDDRATVDAALSETDPLPAEETPAASPAPGEEDVLNTNTSGTAGGRQSGGLASTGKSSMPSVTIDGRSYIGYLSIPELGLDLPVQSRCSETLLKHSPCWYAGSMADGNLVIAGHNYKRHFTPIKRLQPGAMAIFRDVENHETRFRVLRSEIIDGTDVAGMFAGDDWDLTLFTCTYGGKERFAVRLIVDET